MKSNSGAFQRRLIGIALVAGLLLPTMLRAEFKVLFIGNSFTIGSGGGGVPGIFDALARAGGHEDPTTVMRAVGGMDYEFHSLDATTRSIIASQPWTHVILQNYSTEPTHLVDGTHSIADHLQYGASLYRQVMTNNPETKVILFETWSRAAAHPLITGVSGPGGFASTDEFQAELRTNYHRLAAELNAAHPANPPVVVAPVGDAWQNAGGLRPESDSRFVDLHGSDNYHGNNNGYYLSAAVFYSQIYGANPRGLSTHPLVSGLNLGLTVSPSLVEDAAWATVAAGATPSVQSFLLDFGAAAITTVFGADDPENHWNNVTAGIGSSPSGELLNLVTTRNVPTGLALRMVNRFNGANLNGTLASSLFPADATSDSLYGNTEAFNEASNIFPSFRMTGLNPAFSYNLTFFASRTGAADNRETGYTVTGANSGFAALDAANNVDGTAQVNGIRPDSTGEITVSLAPTANNNNANHFTYLGVMRIDAIPPQEPIVFSQQPADVTVSAGSPATFSVKVQGTPPFFIQWFSNDAPLPSATQLTYTIPVAHPAMDGARFSVGVSNLAFSALSTSATLRVTIDSTPPSLQAVSTMDGRVFTLVFSEAISTFTATNTANYLMNNGNAVLLDAALSADAMSVVLTLASAVAGSFSVAVSGVRDLAGNEIVAGALLHGNVPDLNAKSLLVDFGASATSTVRGSPPDDPNNHWNNVTSEIAASPGAQVPNLVTTDNIPTDIDLVMVRRFNGANGNGTTAPAPYPTDATQDSLFGNTEVFSELANIFPSFKLTALNPALAYHFTFYASRTGVSDNRETGYTVTGSNTGFAALNVANNFTNVARVNGVFPSSSGEITISLAPTANNNNANHFTYLGVLGVAWSLPPRLTDLSIDENSFRFRLGGTPGRTYRIEASADFVQWTDVGTETLLEASQLVSRARATPWRFFRAVALPP